MRTALSSAFTVLFLLAAGCGKDATFGLGEGADVDPGTNTGDGGGGDDTLAAEDSGNEPADMGPSADDVGNPGDDSGTVDDDGGAIADDGGLPENDSGTPDSDGGTPTNDGGNPSIDAGPARDGGTPATDGGAPECTSDQECGIAGIFGHCDTAAGVCVECLDNSHCIGGGICDVAGGHQCRRPCFNGGCSLNGVCDATINACVECLMDTDCNGNEVCNPATKSCQACVLDADCALAPNQPICSANGECVGCASDADCPGGEQCHAEQGGYCAPPQGRGLCEPCDNDDQCGGPADLCIGLTSTGGLIDRSCSTDCSTAGSTCPVGYECVSVRAGQAMQCRPGYAMQTRTCTALRNLGEMCLYDPNNVDPGCGIQGLQDARCFANASNGGVCVVWCTVQDDCTAGFTCTMVGNQGMCL